MDEYSENLKERFDLLQDDVDLIKNQIKQNLVDLREFIMNSRTISAGNDQSRPGEKHGLTGGSLSDAVYSVAEHQKRLSGTENKSHINHYEVTGMAEDRHLDAGTVTNLIWWLGTIKRRGLSLRQLSKFLEAYETSGFLDHSMSKLVKVMIRSMEDVNEVVGTSVSGQGSPEEYADCLLQFSEIFCAASERRSVGIDAVESGSLISRMQEPRETYSNGNGVHS